MVQKGYLEGTTYEEYWTHIANHTGTTKDPNHLMSKLLQQMGINADEQPYWEIDGTMIHISDIEDIKGEIREKLKTQHGSN